MADDAEILGVLPAAPLARERLTGSLSGTLCQDYRLTGQNALARLRGTERQPQMPFDYVQGRLSTPLPLTQHEKPHAPSEGGERESFLSL